MFFHRQELQHQAKPDRPDAVYARKLQEVLGGQYGEITVAMQYGFQSWNVHLPGKYRDLLYGIGAEDETPVAARLPDRRLEERVAVLLVRSMRRNDVGENRKKDDEQEHEESGHGAAVLAEITPELGQQRPAPGLSRVGDGRGGDIGHLAISRAGYADRRGRRAGRRSG